MRDADTGAFVALLADVFGLYPSAKSLTETQVAMFVRALAPYPLDQVRAALDAHVRDPQRGRWPPVPADVIAQMAAAAEADGRPGAEEAWAISLAASDERDTVVWSAEMAEAWTAARPVFSRGDEIGARMAFREVYQRLIAEARAARRPLAWSTSLGHDADRRAEAIGAAVQLGRLPQADLLALPGSRVSLVPPPAVRAKLEALRLSLVSLPERPIDTTDRDRAQELKTAIAARVEAYKHGAVT